MILSLLSFFILKYIVVENRWLIYLGEWYQTDNTASFYSDR